MYHKSSSWLGYSALTRATRVRVPVAEFCTEKGRETEREREREVTAGKVLRCLLSLNQPRQQKYNFQFVFLHMFSTCHGLAP